MYDADFTFPSELPYPPFFETELYPADIVGPYASLIKRHVTRPDGSWSEQERSTIAQIYQSLRENGYMVMGTDSLDRIKIGVVLDTLANVRKNYSCTKSTDEMREAMGF